MSAVATVANPAGHTLRWVASGCALSAVLLLGAVPPLCAAAPPATVYAIQADGLSCPFCAYGIEKQLRRIDGVEAVETDVKSGRVVITMKPGARLAKADARRAVEAAGFTMRGFGEQQNDGP